MGLEREARGTRLELKPWPAAAPGTGRYDPPSWGGSAGLIPGEGGENGQTGRNGFTIRVKTTGRRIIRF